MAEYLLQADGVSRFTLGDGSGFLLLAEESAGTPCFTYAGTVGTLTYAGTLLFTYSGTATVTFTYGGSCA